jgi:hypothetical protein
MPVLSADFVKRFVRQCTTCRDVYGSRVATALEHDGLSLLGLDDPRRMAWCNADLFMAGFPRVGVKPGFDVLCYFTLDSTNRSSSLLGYRKDAAPMIKDPLGRVLKLAEKNDEDAGRVLSSVCLIPEMPPGWERHDTSVHPVWIEDDLVRVVHDDGTPEGLFEKAQFLLWSEEPINRWHAVGFGYHELELRPPAPGTFPGLSLPANWLPVVERGRRLSDTELPPEVSSRFEGETCDIAQFWTSSSFGDRAFYKFTVLMADDAWYSSTQRFPTGESGYLV